MKSSLGALALCVGLSASAKAVLLPAARDLALPSLYVVDEAGARRDLRALAFGRPTILLPIFTRCAGTCPVTTTALKKGLAAQPGLFQVVLLSFDPDDEPRDLSDFRERHQLPEAWLLVRGADAARTRAFLDPLGFSLMRSAGSFNHPDASFVFSPRGVWAGTFLGGEFPPRELRRAASWAGSADARGPLARFARWDNLPWAAASVIAVCAVVLMAWPKAHGKPS